MRKVSYLSALLGDVTPWDCAALGSSTLLPISLSLVCGCAQCLHSCFSVIVVACEVTVPVQ